MSDRRIELVSLSAAMDGGMTAIADVSTAMNVSGNDNAHRLIGGVAVMLHVNRLSLDLPLRATADADFGVPPHILRKPELIDALESLGYRRPQATVGSVRSIIAAWPRSICSCPATDLGPVTPSGSGQS